jgi:hypothetical protein
MAAWYFGMASDYGNPETERFRELMDGDDDPTGEEILAAIPESEWAKLPGIIDDWDGRHLRQ